MDMNGMNQAPKNTLGTVLGIVGLCVSILGGILYGVIGAVIGLICGVLGVVFSINAKKASNNQVGGAGFVCGLLGVIFGAIFMIGCAIYGSCTAGYMCYGCLGGSCKAASDAEDILSGNMDMDDLNELYDELEGLDW